MLISKTIVARKSALAIVALIFTQIFVDFILDDILPLEYRNSTMIHLVTAVTVFSMFGYFFIYRSLVSYFVGRAIEETKREKLIDSFGQQLEGLYESTAICVVDSNGICLRVSPIFSELTQYRMDELVGHRLTFLRPIDSNLKFYEQTWQELRGGHIWNGEVRLIKKDKSAIWLTSTAIPIRNSQNELVEIVSFSFDIDYQKKQELLYKKSIEITLDGFFILDYQSKILESNLAFQQMLGYSEAELLNMKLDDIEINEGVEEIEAHKRKVIEDGYDIFETKHRAKDGRAIDVEISVCHIKEIGVFAVFGRDISTKKKLWRELNESKNLARKEAQLKTEFLANMSHEIRTPIHSIQGMIDLIKRSRDANQIEKYIDGISKTSQFLLDLLNDILDLSKMANNSFVLLPKTFGFSQMIYDLEKLMSAEIERKKLKFIVKNEIPENLFVNGDERRIKQIIYNLLRNSVKFTKVGFVALKANVEVLQSGKGSRARFSISVEDSGVGMDKETLDKVFLRYFQADNRESDVVGTGLGLSIAKHILKSMGGHIEVSSTPQLGTKVSIKFQLETVKEVVTELVSEDLNLLPSRASLDSSPSPPKPSDLNILLVEDNIVAHELAAEFLRSGGYRFKGAFDGKEALEIFQSEKFDIILMDFQIPVIDGLNCSKIIREMGFVGPIVGVTANAFLEDKQKGLKAGMSHFLAKPFSYESLIKMIEMSAESLEGREQAMSDEKRVPAIEPSKLLEMKNFKVNGPEGNLMNRMISLFSASADDQINQLRLAIESSSEVEVKRISHKFRSSCMSIGANRASEILGKMENEPFDLSKDKEFYDLLCEEMSQIEDELGKLLTFSQEA